MDLLESKPDYCSNTKPLLHFLTKYLKTKDAEKLFEINISTIYKSHSENQNFDILFQQYPKDTQKQKNMWWRGWND